MVAVSFIWLLALPHQNYSKRTYVSENALLPGGVRLLLSNIQQSNGSVNKLLITILIRRDDSFLFTG